MKKIMFNDRYGLTRAVIEGRKTMTRRLVCKPHYDEIFDNSIDRFNKGWIDHIELIGYKRAYAYKPQYKVGEIVAVAQRYADTYIRDWTPLLAIDKNLAEREDAELMPGWSNKMFVRADLMPHQIRITGVRAERLQNITDEECVKESIGYAPREGVYAWDGRCKGYSTPREAFAALIDKVSGKGTWERNPWVWVYEFELVK